nr:cell wall / vacuolar inhibitor of fructosidase 1-like [Ipomoea batatas]
MKSPFLTSLSIILFLQQISLAAAVAQNGSQVIKIACAQTKAVDLCISVIKSDPRSAGGDVRVFGIIVLDKALSEADGLEKRCPEAYKKLVGDAGDAIGKLKSKELVPSVEDSIKNAINDVAGCRHGDGDDSLVITFLNIAKDVLKIVN